MNQCKICGKDIDPKNPHFILTFNKESLENGNKKIIKTEEGAMICVNFLEVMKEFGISGEKISIDNQYLAKCPFHNQESSFLIDADNKEYFCICEGIKGDVFSFVINYERDVNHKHMTLKQAVDYLMETGTS